MIPLRAPSVELGALAVPADELHYLGVVRRAAVGERVLVMNGCGRVGRGRLVHMDKRSATVHIDDVRDVPKPTPRFALLPLIKGDRFEFAIEKLVEVGVTDIWLYAAARAVVAWDAPRAAQRISKLEHVTDAAERQAGVAHRVTVRGVLPLAEALQVPARTRVIGDGEGVGVAEWRSARGSVPDTSGIATLTGPEGGLTQEEKQLALAANFVAVRFGQHVQRAETAAVAAALCCCE